MIQGDRFYEKHKDKYDKEKHAGCICINNDFCYIMLMLSSKSYHKRRKQDYRKHTDCAQPAKSQGKTDTVYRIEKEDIAEFINIIEIGEIEKKDDPIYPGEEYKYYEAYIDIENVSDNKLEIKWLEVNLLNENGVILGSEFASFNGLDPSYTINKKEKIRVNVLIPKNHVEHVVDYEFAYMNAIIR